MSTTRRGKVKVIIINHANYLNSYFVYIYLYVFIGFVQPTHNVKWQMSSLSNVFYKMAHKCKNKDNMKIKEKKTSYQIQL